MYSLAQVNVLCLSSYWAGGADIITKGDSCCTRYFVACLPHVQGIWTPFLNCS